MKVSDSHIDLKDHHEMRTVFNKFKNKKNTLIDTVEKSCNIIIFNLNSFSQNNLNNN